MKTGIIACRTVEIELLKAMKDTGCTWPVYWLDSGLHDVPKKLHQTIKNQIQKAETDGIEQILFAMGYCGNSLAGLVSNSIEFVIPRVDDCITLFMGTHRARMAVPNASGTYFMTKGWMDREKTIWTEYLNMVEEYGEETGKELFDMMFGNYKQVGVLDTGCYEMDTVIKEAERIAEFLKLETKVISASDIFLKELLQKEWNPDKFLIIPAGQEISMKDLSIVY